MVVETGRVTKVADGKALVEVERCSACAKCHAGCVCDVGKSTMLVEANDPIGVHIDQCVQMSIQSASVLRAAFVVYVVPLLALVGGVLFGQYLGRTFGIRNVLEILIGFGCLGLSLIFVKIYNDIFEQNIKNQPVITKVIG
jgi:sigma-E factor negative regulatory protein RseC